MALLRLLRTLFRRPAAAEPEAAPDALRNWDAEALRAEFKRRYLTEFARYMSEDMVVNHNAAMSFATLAAILGGSMISGPLAAVIGGGLALRHMLIRRDMAAALISAGTLLKRDIELGGTERLAGVETWLDRHEQELPAYLDKLDRAEDEQRLVRRLIARLNKAGTLAGLTRDERKLLARHGYRRLTLPIKPVLRLPPRTELGNWHHAQLSRALWRDVTNTAGDRARPFKRLLGLARIVGRPATEP
ncbi:MAG: hypothetical protein WDN69_36145 [Aliidongia sp.]